MHKPNNILTDDVRDELDYDPLLNDKRIVVKADDGKVTLTGAVDSYPEVLRATDDTMSVKGVTQVDNQLLVGLVGDAITDAQIAQQAAANLDSDRLVPHGSLKVAVSDGWATVTGEVRHHFQVMAAKHDVGRVPGVLGINDKMTITANPIPSDVADRINRAFRRNAIIDESKIQVSVSGHTVFLDGTVDSWDAMGAATDTAWSAPGVTDVVNRLVLVP
ncbi:MAG TPA: BON domain-containing protein [Acidimicrobiales bacterium]|nr:BON domain-containing protein [Acidimicrobiales bacterium]